MPIPKFWIAVWPWTTVSFCHRFSTFKMEILEWVVPEVTTVYLWGHSFALVRELLSYRCVHFSGLWSAMSPLSMHFLALDLQPPQGVYSILTAPMVLDQQLCPTSALVPTLVSPSSSVHHSWQSISALDEQFGDWPTSWWWHLFSRTETLRNASLGRKKMCHHHVLQPFQVTPIAVSSTDCL